MEKGTSSKRIGEKQLRQSIKAAVSAAKRDGREICGLLVDNGVFLELVPVRNKCKRGGGFCFYVGEIRRIVRAAKALNHEVVGTFHSHPVALAEPGASDIRNALDDSLMLVIGAFDLRAKLWRIKNGKARRVAYTRLKS